MDAWLYLSNVAIGVVVWAVTKFGIPWTNREFHTHIPDDPTVNSELTALIQKIWQPELEAHLKRWHAVVPPHTHVENPTPTYTFKTATNTAAPPSAATTLPDSGATNA